MAGAERLFIQKLQLLDVETNIIENDLIGIYDLYSKLKAINIIISSVACKIQNCYK